MLLNMKHIPIGLDYSWQLNQLIYNLQLLSEEDKKWFHPHKFKEYTSQNIININREKGNNYRSGWSNVALNKTLGRRRRSANIRSGLLGGSQAARNGRETPM